MIIESILAGSVWIGAEYLKSGYGGSEKKKLDRIFRKCGLYVKYGGKEDTPKLLRVSKKESFTEYIYRMPEGLSFHDFEKKKQVIEDSLNSKNTPEFSFSMIREFDFRGNYVKQIQTLMKPKNTLKEVYITYDRVLKIKVFNEPLTDYLPYEKVPKCADWEIPIGVTRTGFIKHSFEKICHMVVAGTTLYGKSIFLKNAITTLLLNHPKHVSFILIDLKGGLTFQRFKDCPQVISIASNAEESLEVLEMVNNQIDEVMDYLKQNKFENVQEAGIKNRCFIVVDEGAELSPNIEKDSDLKKIKGKCETILSRVARVSGALGYRLIYATQTPYSEVLNHNIKQNCDAKLCFKLQSDKASEVVLGEGITDAAHLPFIKGRGVYITDRKHTVQTPMIENDFIEGVVERCLNS
ncbi:FtsK/SpoIIIE domain-containing protein [Schinkia azotoformans]|uniref:Cell division protein FtsK/SpoIIIE n=1 Tax=Schinkia azotoformans LMG 9581 TaxID=1131731 RepID=K6DIG9_SCHAZ|nr:FtsK/SpoIIIE domain-containing protein [Schinkia azotoformans]EKN68089.1 cell division protein FtsK/SpoIIIE [Schinkia azotoformans LMG 9581]MEC1638107.1 FtsK/SpoIIIE domain-containing protein [Schinkia azotoformans]MEC1946459.1 FtsK/SpoIIIE domain-containing protein [Schinkia azotoformans]